MGGLLLRSGVDPRLVLAAGLTCTALAAVFCAQYSSAWAAENYYRTELLTGVGQSFALIGLVGGIVLQGVFTGGLSKPQWILTFSAFFHTVRLFGGTAGAIYMGHFLADREKLHSNLLGLHVSSGNWITDANIHTLTAGLFGKSSGLPSAAAGAGALLPSPPPLHAPFFGLFYGFLFFALGFALAPVLLGVLLHSPLSFYGLLYVH